MILGEQKLVLVPVRATSLRPEWLCRVPAVSSNACYLSDTHRNNAANTKWSIHIVIQNMALSYLASTFDTLKEQAKDAIWALSSCLCQQSAKIKINGRTCQYTVVTLLTVGPDCYASCRVTDNTSVVNIIKVLGEGGFSFVYLAQDETSGVSTCLWTSSSP